MKPVKLIKNRSDIGAGTRGSDMGVDAIEVAAINAGSTYFIDFPYIDVKTHNETVYNKVNYSFAKRIAYVHEQCDRVRSTVEVVLAEEYFPIVLSGDHSSAYGTISGIRSQYPDARLGVVWIDAHADLHSPYTSPSGNVHGMPLAAALASDNRLRQTNEVQRDTAQEWRELKQIGIPGAKVQPQDIVMFGVRDTEAHEDGLIEELEIRNYPVFEVRHRGLEVCVDEAITQLENCDLIYISFDVDSMDCDLVSRGTGTPVPKGFDPLECTQIIDRFMDTGKVVCLEVCEVNPLLDNRGNKMAETAFAVLDAVTVYYNEH